MSEKINFGNGEIWQGTRDKEMELARQGLLRMATEKPPREDEAEYETEDNEVDAETLAEWRRADIEMYGEERAEFSNENRRFEVFALPEEIKERYPFLSELPRNVAVMGGMARSIAREMVAGDKEPIRDIDLVNITNSEGVSSNSEEMLDRLAQEYMPDDYEYGHGIQNETLSGYFETRDFTVNEILIMNGMMVMSNYAYDDLQENIIRPTFFEKPSERMKSNSRQFLRALTMQTVLLQTTESYPTIEDVDIRGRYIYPFDVAVQLNKVMSRGAETAMCFTKALAEWNVIPEEFADTPKKLARWLLRCRVDSFEFRPSNDERVEQNRQDDKDSTSQYGKNDFMELGDVQQMYHATDPEVQAALDEYDGEVREELSMRPDVSDERYTGHYTPEEFEEINQQRFDYNAYLDAEEAEDDNWDNDWEDDEDDYEEEEDE